LNNLREDFIKKYYPPIKIWQNRNSILSFMKNDNEHVATTWERLKIMLRTCPSHGVNAWIVLHSFYNGLNYISRSMLDSAAGESFMTKTVTEAKAILENMLQNISQWHTERTSPSNRKVNSIEEVDSLIAKVDAICSYISKQNIDNVPLQDLVENNTENIDINYIRNFGNNGYNNYYKNSYARPPYANNYGNRPFVPYPNTTDSQNKWKPSNTQSTSDYMEKQHELNKSFAKKFASHTTMIEELSKSISSISFDIKGLQLQKASLDKALSKLADNQATLLSTSAGKPHASPMVGMNSIIVSESLPTTFEGTFNELLNYVDLFEPLLLQLESIKEEKKESIMVVENKEVEEAKMLSDKINKPLLDLDKCSLN
jgi:hypothetical protein